MASGDLGVACVFGLFYYLMSRVYLGCFLAAARITYAVVRHIVLILPDFVRVVKESCRISFAAPPPWLNRSFIFFSCVMAIINISMAQAQREAWWNPSFLL